MPNQITSSLARTATARVSLLHKVSLACDVSISLSLSLDSGTMCCSAGGYARELHCEMAAGLMAASACGCIVLFSKPGSCKSQVFDKTNFFNSQTAVSYIFEAVCDISTGLLVAFTGNGEGNTILLLLSFTGTTQAKLQSIRVHLVAGSVAVKSVYASPCHNFVGY